MSSVTFLVCMKAVGEIKKKGPMQFKLEAENKLKSHTPSVC